MTVIVKEGCMTVMVKEGCMTVIVKEGCMTVMVKEGCMTIWSKRVASSNGYKETLVTLRAGYDGVEGGGGGGGGGSLQQIWLYLVYVRNIHSGGHHEEINIQHFMESFKKQMIPNLPSSCVIMLHNATSIITHKLLKPPPTRRTKRMPTTVRMGS